MSKWIGCSRANNNTSTHKQSHLIYFASENIIQQTVPLLTCQWLGHIIVKSMEYCGHNNIKFPATL